MISKLAKIWAKIKGNQRYAWAFLVLLAVFFINQSNPSEVITSEICQEENCKKSILEANLTDNSPRYFVNDLFNSREGDFYRIIFHLSSNQKTSLSVFATNPLDQDKKLKDLEIDGELTQEVIFSSDGSYTDLSFQKNDPRDGADISVGQISISKMNITSEKEIAELVPTIIGDADREIEDQKQLEDKHSFPQLKSPDIIFGQVFWPEMDYITKISLDLDVVKQGNNGGKKYALELREVEYESADVPEIKSSPLAIIKFSFDDLEKYRQENGKFIFPLVAKLEQGKPYFIGINNDRADISEFNHLIPKGSSEKSAYPKGTLAVKFNKNSYSVPGSLYFKTYGFKVREYNGISILPGAIIEDRGKGQIFYSYQNQENDYELLNINSYLGNIGFNDEKSAITGEIDPSAVDTPYFTYKFETIYPVKNWSISGIQGDILWNKIRLSYSYDQKEWNDIPSQISQAKENQGYQIFDYLMKEKGVDKKTVYLKIDPEKDKLPEQTSFGIKNLRFQAELLKKN